MAYGVCRAVQRHAGENRLFHRTPQRRGSGRADPEIVEYYERGGEAGRLEFLRRCAATG